LKKTQKSIHRYFGYHEKKVKDKLGSEIDGVTIMGLHEQ
jgi:hypothetical protein